MNSLKRLLCYKNILRHKRFYNSDIYEPDYLESLKPKVPIYDLINIQLKGYDYPVLEQFQASVHFIAKNVDVEVEDGWATPAKNEVVKTFKPKSEQVNAQYNLTTYFRTIQAANISSSQLSILLRAIAAATPPGVTVNVVPHEEDHEEIRYVPDHELLKLKQELDDMGGPRKK